MTVTDHTQDISPDEKKKQRKKLAKREAKLMLQVEEARKGLKKSEQKVEKAQKRLEESKQALYNLELQLRQVRENQTGTATEIATPAETTNDEIAVPTLSTEVPEELSGTPVSTTLEQEQATIQVVAAEQSEIISDETPNEQDAAQEQGKSTLAASSVEHTAEVSQPKEAPREAAKPRRSRAQRRSRNPREDTDQSN